jgi:hypothetical protein
MLIQYPGDSEAPIVSWLRNRLKGIQVALESDLREAALILIFSRIDRLGWLSSDVSQQDATGETFKAWCDQYLLGDLRSVDQETFALVDLWAAPCGLLHTSIPQSKLSREGKAREVQYKFGKEVGVNLFGASKLDPLVLDIEHFALCFKSAAIALLNNGIKDEELSKRISSRSNNFFRWATLVRESDLRTT